VEKQAHMQVAL